MKSDIQAESGRRDAREFSRLSQGTQMELQNKLSLTLSFLFGKMKSFLPPQLSLRLRYFKSMAVDHEMKMLEAVARKLGGQNRFALDVGANSGIYSTLLARRFARVISIEPNPSCVDYLRKGLPGKCVVLPVAASDVSAETVLRIPVTGQVTETTRGTISRENKFLDLQCARIEEVPVKTAKIDDVVPDLIPAGIELSLIKIDVEGHEFAALLGATETIKRFHPAIYIELENRHGTDAVDLLEHMYALGYRAHQVSSGAFTEDTRLSTELGRRSFFEHDQIVNLLLIHGSKDA